MIKRIKGKSSKTAANELVSKYYKEIYIYIYRQTIDQELSMDLTQEVFISMLQTINNYDDRKASFRTWLYKISTYRLVDYYRSKYYKYNNMVTPIDDCNLCDHQNIAVTVENRQDIEQINSFVNKLDFAAQQVFRLKFFSEYTFSEIAEILQISESTAKTRYYALLKKIRKEMRGRLDE